MKVLQINSVCGKGSTGKIASDLLSVLKNNGYEGIIAYGRDRANNCAESFKIGNDLDVKLHAALSRLTDKSGFYSKHFTKLLINKIKQYNPNIIHLHNIHGYYVNFKLLVNFLIEYNKPVVWTLHDCWIFTGHCAYYTYLNCDKFINGCSDCPNLNSYPKSYFDNSKNNYNIKKNLLLKLNNVVYVTPSLWLKNEVSKSFLGEKKCLVINNGIDDKVFSKKKSNFRKKYNLDNKKILLGVANVWEKRKGLSDFIKISKLLNDNEVIVLVGKGLEKIEHNNIITISRTSSQEELAEIYSEADYFLNPTYEDNYPTTNLESLACGTPVITYNTGGSPEPVLEGCGSVVDVGDYIEMYNRTKLKYDAYKIKDISKNLSKDVCFNKYIELYNSLL